MPERPASTIAIWTVAAVLAVLAGVRLLGGGGETESPPVRVDGAPGAAHGGQPAAARHSEGGPGTASAGTADLYVHVAGSVRRPGLIRVPAGSRVAVALERAGGPTRRADLAMVNLAAELQDGQQIVVPARGAVSAAAGAAGATGPDGAAPGAAGGPRIHLSTATADQLDEIDGIGPTLAERIVEYRDAHGATSPADLAEVEGIGEKRLETLRNALQP